MRLQTALLSVILCATRLALCDEAHHHPLTEEESARFTSQPLPTCFATDFTGLFALLHSFSTAGATSVHRYRRKDRSAMAHWGWPWSHYHGMWGNGDSAAGGIALARQNRSPQAIRRLRPGKGLHRCLAEVYRETEKVVPRTVRLSSGNGGSAGGLSARHRGCDLPRSNAGNYSSKTDKTLPINASAGKFWNLFCRSRIIRVAYIAHDILILAERGLGARSCTPMRPLRPRQITCFALSTRWVRG